MGLVVWVVIRVFGALTVDVAAILVFLEFGQGEGTGV